MLFRSRPATQVRRALGRDRATQVRRDLGRDRATQVVAARPGSRRRPGSDLHLFFFFCFFSFFFFFFLSAFSSAVSAFWVTFWLIDVLFLG